MATIKEKILAYIKKHPGALSGTIIRHCASGAKTGKQQVSKLLGEMVHSKTLDRSVLGSKRNGFKYFIPDADKPLQSKRDLDLGAESPQKLAGWNASHPVLGGKKKI